MSIKTYLPLLFVTLALSACSDGFFGGEKEKAPLPGTRIAILDKERALRPEEDVKVTGFEAADSLQNDAWPQAGGEPDHALQNVALSSKQLQKVWSTDIGDGSSKNVPLTAQPVVVGKSVFTLDTDANLSAFSTEDGKRRWSVSVRQPDEDDAVIGGGIAYDAGILYVTAGYDEIVAVEAQSGKITWRAALTSPSRAAPTVSGGRVFVTTLANSILAFNVAGGASLWEFSGLGQSTGLVGAASPAASGDLVVPAFSSGELYALRATNGSVAWSDNLSNSLRLGGMSGLSDIRGLPVIHEGIVYAVSFGGKMVAVDILTGARVWQKDISGAKTPWLAGNRVFLISSEGQVVAIDKDNGAVVWVSQLARYKDKEDKTGPIFWTGPILAGGRLLAFSTDGRAAEINPAQGTLVREWGTGEDIRITPVVAGGTLYLLSEDGELIAYR